MNRTPIITLPARCPELGSPHRLRNNVSAAAARPVRAWQQFNVGLVSAILAFVLGLTGALMPGFSTPACAQETITYEQIKSFGPGEAPASGLIQGPDGVLYGSNDAAVFKLNTDGSGYTVLHNFDTVSGGRTLFVLDSNNVLYGGEGTLFKVNSDGSNFTVIGTIGGEVLGLIEGRDHALYGVTRESLDGRALGTVFRLNKDPSNLAVLHRFEDPHVSGPVFGGVVQGTDGALYGITDLVPWGYDLIGGTGPKGTVFKMDTDGSNFTFTRFFDYSTSGGSPKCTLIQGVDDALYGTTFLGGSTLGSSGDSPPLGVDGPDGLGFGTVFKINTAGTESAVLVNFDYFTTGAFPEVGVIQGRDGLLYGTTSRGGSHDYGTVFSLSLSPDGTGFSVLLNLDSSTSGVALARLIQGTDGNLYGTTQDRYLGGGVFRLILGDTRITTLTPPSRPSGSGGFTLEVNGFLFTEGVVVQWNGADLETTFVSTSKLTAVVPNTPTTADIYTALITVKNPDETISSPTAFLVLPANVADAESSVAVSGQSVSVSNSPTTADQTDNTAGVTATVSNSGDTSPVTVTAAIYNSNPSPSTAFEIDSATGVAGEFLDLQVTGADDADTMIAYFYYPVGTAETGTSPTLKYYDGAAWASVLTSGGNAPLKDTSENLDGTLSGGRFTVTFDNTSTPKITELGGTFFAMTVPRPPLTFTGFLVPIGGADEATGGSFAHPVQTFKGGSTIPVKFKISRTGTAVVTGVHRLQAAKYSDATTSAAAIDATPQEAATSGNQFILKGSEWHFNLDTKSTGLTKGIWQLTATLSDGSRHYVWIQIK